MKRIAQSKLLSGALALVLISLMSWVLLRTSSEAWADRQGCGTPACASAGLSLPDGTVLSLDDDFDSGELLCRVNGTITGCATAAPSAHASDHENGGPDEISVDGLAGVLADYQAANIMSTGAPGLAVTGDGNSGIGATGSDEVSLYAGGTKSLAATASALTCAVPVLAPIGTAGAPSVAYSADTDNGLYFATNTTNISAGGTQRAQFDATGLGWKPGSLSTTVPSLYSLDDTDTGIGLSATNTGVLIASGVAISTWTTAGESVTQAVSTSGAPTLFTATGAAHTGLTASTEAVDINWNLARTVQHATGALATQRAFLIQPPTYSFVGASTLTDAVTFEVSGPPVAGTNATITRPWAARFAGNVGFGDGTDALPSIAFSAHPGWGLKYDTSGGGGLSVSTNGAYNTVFYPTNVFFGPPIHSGSAGTAGAPRYSWSTDNNSGLFSAGADSPAMSAGGTAISTWTTSGESITGTLNTTGNITENSVRVLTVAGSGLTSSGGTVAVGAGTCMTVAADSVEPTLSCVSTALSPGGSNGITGSVANFNGALTSADFITTAADEYDSLTQKTTPLRTDLALIESAANSNAKRYATVGDLVNLGVGGIGPLQLDTNLSTGSTYANYAITEGVGVLYVASGGSPGPLAFSGFDRGAANRHGDSWLFCNGDSYPVRFVNDTGTAANQINPASSEDYYVAPARCVWMQYVSVADDSGGWRPQDPLTRDGTALTISSISGTTIDLDLDERIYEHEQSIGSAAILTGIANGWPGRHIRIRNTSTSNYLKLPNESASSSAGNKLRTPWVGDIWIAPQGSVEFTYSGAIGSGYHYVDSATGLARTAYRTLKILGTLTTGDGKDFLAIDSEISGYNLTAVVCRLGTAGTVTGVTVDIDRIRQTSATAQSTVSVFSTKATTDATEFSTVTAATPAVINTSNDDVQDGATNTFGPDLYSLNNDGIPTGGANMVCTLAFSPP